MLTRRVLLSAVAAEAAACAAPDGPTGPGSLDRSLDALHETDPEYENGLSNHGPMAAEALEALGHTERIEPFVDGYIDRLVPLEAGAPLGDAEQIGALGDVATRARWIATFIALLAESDPATLV